MNTKTFNQNYELDRKARGGVRANQKHAPAEPLEIMTADGVSYNKDTTYYFFDEQSAEIRQSLGLPRDGTHLCTFGLRVVAVANLREDRDSAFTDGQKFFNSEIKRLQERIQEFELGKGNQ